MSMEDLLKALLGDGEQPSGGQGSGADPLADLLGSILGGASQRQGTQRATPGQAGTQGVGDLGDILGSILGGAGQRGIQRATPGQTGAQGAGGLGDILGSVLGGATTPASGATGVNPLLAPIVDTLAKKLGLSPAIAQAVVSFGLSKLLPSLLGGAAAAQGRVRAAPGARAPLPSLPSQGQGLDLDYLLERAGGGQEVEASYLQSTGMVDELARQTGLDDDTATRSLQQVFDLFGTRLATARPATKPAGLDSMLDTWKSESEQPRPPSKTRVRRPTRGRSRRGERL